MPEPVEVVGTYQDQAGKRATNTLYVAAGLTIAQMIEGLQALAPLVDNVLDAVINGIDFTVSIDTSGLAGNISVGTSDVEEVGEFISRTAAGRETKMNLPAINPTLSPAGSDNLDPAHLNVAPLISMLEDGLVTTGGTIIPTDVDENDLVQVITARDRTRNSGSRGG